VSERWTNRQAETDRQRDRQTEGRAETHSYRETGGRGTGPDRQTDRQTDTQTDTQTDRQRKRKSESEGEGERCSQSPPIWLRHSVSVFLVLLSYWLFAPLSLSPPSIQNLSVSLLLIPPSLVHPLRRQTEHRPKASGKASCKKDPAAGSRTACLAGPSSPRRHLTTSPIWSSSPWETRAPDNQSLASSSGSRPGRAHPRPPGRNRPRSGAGPKPEAGRRGESSLRSPARGQASTNMYEKASH